MEIVVARNTQVAQADLLFNGGYRLRCRRVARLYGKQILRYALRRFPRATHYTDERGRRSPTPLAVADQPQPFLVSGVRPICRRQAIDVTDL